jgi:hypothetical protein
MISPASPRGRHVVKLCRAKACQARGGAAVEAAAAQRLGVAMGETRGDGAVTLEPVYCLGLCAVGPAALVDGEPVARIDGENAGPDRGGGGGMIRAFVSRDMASVALGADAVAAGALPTGVRGDPHRQRGLFASNRWSRWKRPQGRIGFGPVGPDDVAAVLDGSHRQPAGPGRCPASFFARTAALHLRPVRHHRSAEPDRLCGAWRMGG